MHTCNSTYLVVEVWSLLFQTLTYVFLFAYVKTKVAIFIFFTI